MANIAIKDASGATVYMSATGAGTLGDPFVVQHTVVGTQAISAAALPLPAGAATEAALTTLSGQLPGLAGTRSKVEPLGLPNIASTTLTSAVSQTVTLDPDTQRVSVYATAATRYVVGSGVGVLTASASSHFIAAGERLDFAVPADGKIAVLQDTTPGNFEITEYFG